MKIESYNIFYKFFEHLLEQCGCLGASKVDWMISKHEISKDVRLIMEATLGLIGGTMGLPTGFSGRPVRKGSKKSALLVGSYY